MFCDHSLSGEWNKYTKKISEFMPFDEYVLESTLSLEQFYQSEFFTAQGIAYVVVHSLRSTQKIVFCQIKIKRIRSKAF